MTISRVFSRMAAPRVGIRFSACKTFPAFAHVRYSQHEVHPSKISGKPLPIFKITGFLLTTILAGGLVYYSPLFKSHLDAKTTSASAEIEFEQPRKKPSSPEENRDLISSQHLQVRKSWENPGVYAWGNNSGRVIEDSDETYIKTAKRISYFDGKLVRDIKLDKTFGAAIAENGDLLQWGVRFSPTCSGPTPTITGKKFVKLSISKDRIIALSSSGKIYSVPASQSKQLEEPSPDANSWFRLWGSSSKVGYQRLEPDNLKWGEKFVDISSGLEHSLLLTNKGRLFSAASASEDFPTKGQLGIPGLTLLTKPPGPMHQLYEIQTLKGFEISKIATGDFHSIALDKEGRVFTFGDNSSGQLGFDPSLDSPTVDAPSLLPFDKLYKGTNMYPKVTGVAAGGANSFFTIDATRIAGQSEDDPRNLGRVTVDTWSCGQGILGGLGNGRWTHIQSTPTKIKALSGLFEYDEKNKVITPIRLAKLSVGQTHMSAVMNNVTQLDVDENSSANETNWGADVLWWGGNENYQLGTGKRSNVSQPIYIQPLDVQADRDNGRYEKHRFHITPRKQILMNGRKVSVEQRVECGRGLTSVYSGT